MRALFALIAGLLLAIPALAQTPPEATPAEMTAPEVTAPIHQFIDGFNSGDLDSAYAAYAPGEVVIIDEFAPHVWTGADAVHVWAGDFGKMTQSQGITGGKLRYDAPTRVESAGDAAYVIVPTVFRYAQQGKPMAEEGQMTFVLNRGADGWKIRGWTWTGGAPHAAE